tara:strand:- start:1331 stop:1996 length:666 start_codon:yes stop_codon:yes gene_type:complete
MPIHKFTILGERCSGTNYLENLILLNFDVKLTWEYGWKHYFGFNDYTNSDDTLFICIVRNYNDYLDSFFRNPAPSGSPLKKYFKTIDSFINSEWLSYEFQKKIIKEDLNIYTHKPYKNILELRHIKLKYLIETFPKKVKNCILIKYEDLKNDFSKELTKIQNMGLKCKHNSFINYIKYKDTNKNYGDFQEQKNENYKKFKIDKIHDHPDFNTQYEKILGYI